MPRTRTDAGPDTAQLIDLTHNASGAPGTPNRYLNSIMSTESVQVDGKVDVLKIEHHYGNGSRGGRNSFEVFSWFDSPSAAGKNDRNYCGFATTFYANSKDSLNENGLHVPAGFAANLQALVMPGVDWYNITGGEINIGIFAGGSATLKSGLSIAQSPVDAVRARQYDCGLSISSSSTLGFRHCILFSDYNGMSPVQADGTLIGTAGAQIALRGVDFTSYNFSDYAFASVGFRVTGFGNVRATSHDVTGNFGGKVDLIPGVQARIGWNASGSQGEVAYINSAPANAINSHEWYVQSADGTLHPMGAVDTQGNWNLGASITTGLIKLSADGAAVMAFDNSTKKLKFLYNGTALFSIDTAGNMIAKGTILQGSNP